MRNLILIALSAISCTRIIGPPPGLRNSYDWTEGPIPTTFYAVATLGVCCRVNFGNEPPPDEFISVLDGDEVVRLPLVWAPRFGGFEAFVDLSDWDQWFVGTMEAWVDRAAPLPPAPVPHVVTYRAEPSEVTWMRFEPAIINYVVELSFQWEDQPWTEPVPVFGHEVSLKPGAEYPSGEWLPVPALVPVQVRARSVDMSGARTDWAEPVVVTLAPPDRK